MRIFFAAMFLFVLLAEFGSHVLAHASLWHDQGHLVSVVETNNDEPCEHVIPCCENSHSSQQLPNSGHQVLPGDLIEVIQLVSEIEINTEPPIPYTGADALFRESQPPFHPPKLS